MIELQNWLNSKRDWSQGVALYLKHGKNHHLKRQFSRLPESEQRREKLEHELSGLVKQPAMAKKPVVLVKKPAKQAQKSEKSSAIKRPAARLEDLNPHDTLAYTDSRMQKIVFDELPEELKPQYIQLIDLERKARMIHWELRFIDPEKDAERRGKMAHDIVFSKDRAAEIYARIDHWLDKGEVLSTTQPSLNVKTMSDMELLKLEKNTKAYVSTLEKRRIPEIEKKIKSINDHRKRQIEDGKLKLSIEKLNQHRANLLAARNEIESRNEQPAK